MEMFKAMRLLGDKGRVRILRLLAREDLSVAELQEILGMGQSRISMQLSQLKQAGFADVRRSGQKSIYRASAPPGAQAILLEVLRASEEIAEAVHDDEQFQQGLVDRRTGRLDHEDIPAADILVNSAPDLAVGEVLQRDFTERIAEALRNLFSQRQVGAAAEHLEAVVVHDAQALDRMVFFLLRDDCEGKTNPAAL